MLKLLEAAKVNKELKQQLKLIGLYQYFNGKESVPPSILDRMDDLVEFYDESQNDIK